jgi:hypothetical protein
LRILTTVTALERRLPHHSDRDSYGRMQLAVRHRSWTCHGHVLTRISPPGRRMIAQGDFVTGLREHPSAPRQQDLAIGATKPAFELGDFSLQQFCN